MDMNQLTKITIAWEMFSSGVPKSHIASQLGVNRETVHLWIKGILEAGLLEFLDDYVHAKKGERSKRKVDIWLKNKIYEIREDNRECCGQKISEYLKRDYGVSLGTKAIYKVLGEKYKLRSKWKKNTARGPVPEAFQPREVIQMDSVNFGAVFAFTAVDIFSKEVVVKLYPSLTAQDGLDFLTFSFDSRYQHTNLLQTDGGSEFKAEFRSHVFEYADRFRVSRPYKKNEQSYIESFNRSLRKECLGWSKYQPKDIPDLEKELSEYLVYYHDRRVHIGLGMKTPNQLLEQVSDI
jgi:transposase InsO family protein